MFSVLETRSIAAKQVVTLQNIISLYFYVYKLSYSSVYNAEFFNFFPCWFWECAVYTITFQLFFRPIAKKTEYLLTQIIHFLYNVIKCFIIVLLILYMCCFIYFCIFHSFYKATCVFILCFYGLD